MQRKFERGKSNWENAGVGYLGIEQGFRPLGG